MKIRVLEPQACLALPACLTGALRRGMLAEEEPAKPERQVLFAYPPIPVDKKGRGERLPLTGPDQDAADLGVTPVLMEAHGDGPRRFSHWRGSMA